MSTTRAVFTTRVFVLWLFTQWSVAFTVGLEYGAATTLQLNKQGLDFMMSDEADLCQLSSIC